MNIAQRIRGWWMREQIVTVLLDQFVQGTGVTYQEFPVGTEGGVVLDWIDQQLGDSRTPSGFSAFKIVFGTQGPPLFEATVARRRQWYAEQQARFVEALTPVLARESVTVTLAAFGTMLAVAATPHAPASESSAELPRQ